jgi:hypothetical protein
MRAPEPERLPNYLGGECKLLIGSYGFPIVLRELGTRHAFPSRFNPVESVTPPFRFHSSTIGALLDPTGPAGPLPV